MILQSLNGDCDWTRWASRPRVYVHVELVVLTLGSPCLVIKGNGSANPLVNPASYRFIKFVLLPWKQSLLGIFAFFSRKDLPKIGKDTR